MDGLFDFDILKGAKHVYKPPPPPKPQRSVQKSSSSLLPSNSKQENNTQSSTKSGNKSMIVKKPQPVSFEEMMKLASKNLTKDDKPLPLPLPPPLLPKPQQSVQKSSSTSLPSKSTNSKPMMKLPSKNLIKDAKPSPSLQPPPKPPKLQQSVKKFSTSSLPSKPTYSKHGNDTQPSTKNTQPLKKSANNSKILKKPQPSSFNEMMKLASKNLTKEDKPSPPSQRPPPQPQRSVQKSSSSSLPLKSTNSKHGNTQSSTKTSINKSMVVKKPQPSSFKEPTKRLPSKHLIKDDRTSSRPPKRPRYEDEYDDDDDSMDDFIVDDEEENVQNELKKVLRNYYRSDESVWQKREKEIDLSKMNARYQEIDAEEKRSYRIARMEDMIEEKRGSKALQ
uniref:Protein SPT2 homolog n=1 Tax=Panagrolaimus sp. ES5 TaxID=591445 RepID=A0AC34GMV8_9BILA